MIQRIFVDQLHCLQCVESLPARLLPLEIPKRVVVPTMKLDNFESLLGFGYCFEQILVLTQESFLSGSVEVNQREGWVDECFADDGVLIFVSSGDY